MMVRRINRGKTLLAPAWRGLGHSEQHLLWYGCGLQWRWVIALLLAMLWLSSQQISAQALEIPLEQSIDFRPLKEHRSTRLEIQLLRELRLNAAWKKLIQQKKLAVALVDLSDPAAIRYAEVNGNEMMYAASLPKIAILLAAMDALEKGELEDTDVIQKDLELMISKSDNRASTRMIDRLGYQKIAAVLTAPRYALYDEEGDGGLWVGKRYAAAGQRFPDPIKGLSHAASARQVARFYYLLAFGQLVNAERSEQMLEIMVDPALQHKLVNTYKRIAPRAKLFRKSGSWRNFHSDSILVWGPERHYILVALVEAENGEMIIRQLGESIDKFLLATP